MGATGAAALGVLTGVPQVAAKMLPATHDGTAEGPLVAYVRDARRGELTVMAGGKEVAVHDPDLVRRIVRASH